MKDVVTMDVRERTREILRAELAEAAADFCAEHGFENVTVEEIAQHIGVSRTTYFRYFASKEDAIVVSATTTKESIQHFLRSHPPAPGVNVMGAVREALTPTVEAAREHPGASRARIRMIDETPSLRARLAADRAEQRDALTDLLAEYVASDTEARAVAAVSTAAIELGWSLWVETVDGDLGAAFDRAFALVGEAPGVLCASPTADR